MIYCYGVTALSRILRLKWDFPKPNGYGEVLESADNIGGEAVGTAMCLARFGHKVVLDGLKVSRHGMGKWALQQLAKRGVDASRIASSRARVGAIETVYSDNTTRTVFANYVATFADPTQMNRPSEDLIRKAAHITVDPFLKADSDRAAQLARKYQVPYSLMDLRHDNPYVPSAASVILSQDFLGRFYKGKSIPALLRLFLSRMRGLLVVTQGAKAVWFGRSGGPIRRQKVFMVKVKDTTGAGDAFRAGVVHGLVQRWPDAQTISFASALAALICQSFPGCMNSPSLKQVEAFLRKHG